MQDTEYCQLQLLTATPGCQPAQQQRYDLLFFFCDMAQQHKTA